MNLPIEHDDFHSFLYVYQRVTSYLCIIFRVFHHTVTVFYPHPAADSSLTSWPSFLRPGKDAEHMLCTRAHFEATNIWQLVGIVHGIFSRDMIHLTTIDLRYIP